ncbi:MAG: HEAT repeat domain-containing protein [Planctomycetota bacterium]
MTRAVGTCRAVLCLLALLGPAGTAAACEAEPPRRIRVEELAKKLASRRVADRLSAVRGLGEAESDLDTRPAAEALGSVLDDRSPKVRLAALDELGSVLRRDPIETRDLSDEAGDRSARAEQLLGRVVAATRKEDQAERAAALRALGRFFVPRAVARLKEAASHEDPHIRLAAVRGMGHASGRHSRHFFEPLLARIEDPDVGVQRAAIKALFHYGYHDKERRKAVRAAVRPLLKMAEDRDHPVWKTAAWALGRAKAGDAVPLLVKWLEDPDRAKTAAGALNQIRTPAAVDALVRGLKDERPAVRCACAGNLTYLDEKYDRQVTGPLLAALDDPDAGVIRRAVRAIRRRPKAASAAVPKFIGLLNHTACQVRRPAARALGRLHAKQAIPALRPLLDDPSDAVREEAARALKRLGVEDVRRGQADRPGEEDSRAGLPFSVGLGVAIVLAAALVIAFSRWSSNARRRSQEPTGPDGP